MRSVFLAATLLALSGCAEFQQAPGVLAQPARDWRAVATESLKRITAWGLRERAAQVRRAWGRR